MIPMFERPFEIDRGENLTLNITLHPEKNPKVSLSNVKGKQGKARSS